MMHVNFSLFLFNNFNSKNDFIRPISVLLIRDKDQNIIWNTIAYVSDRCGRREERSRCANEVGILQCFGLDNKNEFFFPTKFDCYPIN